MKKLLFLMLAVMVGVSASAQSLPDVKIENIHFADSLLTLSYRIANR